MLDRDAGDAGGAVDAGATGPPRRDRVPAAVLACLLLVAGCATTGSQEAADPIFYPGLPDTPRIQFLTTITSDVDVTGGLSNFDEYLLGEQDTGELAKPYGVAIRAGKVFVCDTIASHVAILDLKGKKIEILGDRQPGRLQKPINIAVDVDGTRYVTDRKLQRVMVYDADNRFLHAFGSPEVWAPTDIAIRGDDLFVTDVSHSQVVMLDKTTGEEIRRIGERGIGEAQLLLPTNLAVDEDRNIYVADTGNYRIQKLDTKGRYLMHVGEAGDAVGNFARPKGIDVDREGRLYAVDAAFSNVQLFDEDGRLLLVFGSAGTGPGDLYLPAKVKVDYENVDLFANYVAPGYEVEYLILVTNQYGPNKVNVYGFLRQPDDEE